MSAVTDRQGTGDGAGSGTGSAVGSGTGSGADRRAEDELRVLLERAVPQPAAPPQRLERVRERVRRRRRRRTAVVTGSAALAVAAALLAVPGLVRPQGGAAPVVVATGGRAERPATPPASSVPEEPPSTEPPTPAAGYGDYRPPGMDGLRLRLPPGWRALSDPAPGTGELFVSSQALALPASGCRHALDGFCTPLARTLGSGGALLMFQLDHNQGMADKLRLFGTPIGEEAPYKACRTVGGTRQLGASIVDQAGSSTVVTVTACLAQPSAAQLAQAEAVVTTAAFG